MLTYPYFKRMKTALSIPERSRNDFELKQFKAGFFAILFLLKIRNKGRRRKVG
jgi:hypothetical protein